MFHSDQRRPWASRQSRQTTGVVLLKPLPTGEDPSPTTRQPPLALQGEEGGAKQSGTRRTCCLSQNATWFARPCSLDTACITKQARSSPVVRYGQRGGSSAQKGQIYKLRSSYISFLLIARVVVMSEPRSIFCGDQRHQTTSRQSRQLQL